MGMMSCLICVFLLGQVGTKNLPGEPSQEGAAKFTELLQKQLHDFACEYEGTLVFFDESGEKSVKGTDRTFSGTFTW